MWNDPSSVVLTEQFSNWTPACRVQTRVVLFLKTVLFSFVSVKTLRFYEGASEVYDFTWRIILKGSRTNRKAMTICSHTHLWHHMFVTPLPKGCQWAWSCKEWPRPLVHWQLISSCIFLGLMSLTMFFCSCGLFYSRFLQKLHFKCYKYVIVFLKIKIYF